MNRSDIQKISVVIVTWNSASDIIRLLGSLRRQSASISELIVVDNASVDSSIKLVKRYWPESRIIKNKANKGFAIAANQGIDEASNNLILLINPDMELHEDFTLELAKAIHQDDSIASACGKLLHLDNEKKTSIIDSTGIVMTSGLRHLDRGAQEIDRGQYDEMKYVFGATGAGILLRRDTLDKIRIKGKVFDERFHSYREDADLAWRLQLSGFRCVYTPKAIGWHKRRVTPEKRASIPDWINKNSVRNRFLLRINNLTTDVAWQTMLPAALRDILVIGACCTIETSSLPAFWELLKMLPESISRRKETMKLVQNTNISRWFQFGYTEEDVEI